MFDTFTFKWLFWRPLKRALHALPAGVERFFIDTPSGKIEVIFAAASPLYRETKSSPPLFFVHGGMGGAWVWHEYLQYFSARGIPCYAVSMRGHGDSWCPSFLRMVYGTTKSMLADDVVAAIRWAQQREGGSDVVLVAHSSGGGLAQYILSDRRVRVRGLVLAAAVPGFGSFGVYMNWFRLDPWFTVRMIFHGWHPNSPLSHPVLTRRVFFSNELPDDYVEKFQQKVNPYESFLWPLGMSAPFVRPQTVLQQIAGWGSVATKSQRLLVLRGEDDKIMDRVQMEKLAVFYRTAFTGLVADKKVEAEDEDIHAIPGEGGQDSVGHGVRLSMVPKAGHHLQNDVTWEVGARKLLEFYEQL